MSSETLASGTPVISLPPLNNLDQGQGWAFPSPPPWIRPIGNLAKAFAAAQAEYLPIVKDKIATIRSEKTGATFTYHYATWAQVLKIVLPCLAKHELAFSQGPVHRDGKQYLCSILLHSSGEVLESQGVPFPYNLGSREYSAALTYARKQDGCAFLAVAAEDETDAPLPAPKAEKTRKAAPPPPEPEPAETPTLPDPLKDERLQAVAVLQKYKPIVGVNALKAFIEKETGETKPKNVSTDQLKLVAGKLTEAAEGGTDAVIKLVLGEAISEASDAN